MAFSIELGPRERIGLEASVSQQTGKAGDLRVFWAILEKVRCDELYRKTFMRPVMGGIAWDEEAIAHAELFHVELDREEIHKIQDVLRDWPGFSTADYRWISPLTSQLSDALNRKPTP